MSRYTFAGANWAAMASLVTTASDVARSVEIKFAKFISTAPENYFDYLHSEQKWCRV